MRACGAFSVEMGTANRATRRPRRGKRRLSLFNDGPEPGGLASERVLLAQREQDPGAPVSSGICEEATGAEVIEHGALDAQRLAEGDGPFTPQLPRISVAHPSIGPPLGLTR